MSDLSNFKLININFNNKEHMFFVKKELTKKQIKKMINQCIENTNNIVKEGGESEKWYLIDELQSKGFIMREGSVNYEFNINDKILNNVEKILYKKLK